MGAYQIDGREAIWVWIILAGITVWDFVTLLVPVAWQKLIAISQAISCIWGWNTFLLLLVLKKKHWMKGCSSSWWALLLEVLDRITERPFMSSWIPQWLVSTAVFWIQSPSNWASHKYRRPWKIISVPLFFFQFHVWLYFSLSFCKREGPSDCAGGWTIPQKRIPEVKSWENLT